MPALLTVAFFIKTTKTAHQLKSNEVTVASVWQITLYFTNIC